MRTHICGTLCRLFIASLQLYRKFSVGEGERVVHSLGLDNVPKLAFITATREQGEHSTELSPPPQTRQEREISTIWGAGDIS